ncbi:M14 family metallopeptidase [Neotamlana laminarinivorans]|uniref:M14 family metallopeptidase n=1 Tax=Neotamlana laminarinivorans TaxID=2883124 RepID=A0A9X1L4V7_9FLAO|nr:M14 family metallopeptidase [Tamlana laminarinivorans]MCB4799889.1 M14 family metallopeptidase [Tamlana laminarinivorans]
MKKLIFLLLIISSCSQAEKTHNFKTVFEKNDGKETATYNETISFYKKLAQAYSSIKIDSFGLTDSNKPLHLVTLNPNNEFNFKTIRKTKRILFINNGIHPGEPDGIDATMMLFRDLANGKIKVPNNTVLVTIPIYNIGGSLNRNSTSRTNQNGPVSYGFRGNARNYDLNRDFIKCDTKNAKSFAEIFHLVKPDVFIDNHVSNGADYQYTLTHLFTQHNKLAGNLGEFLHESLMPELEQSLAAKEWDITPYVNVFNKVPESGFNQFLDYPRYSTGYTTLFNTLGMMVETHMLKPYKPRVEGTYELMKSMLEITDNEAEEILTLRKNALNTILNTPLYTLDWQVDTTKHTTLQFKGFEAETITSEITGLDRLKYNRDKPFTKPVKYNNYFKPTTQVSIPKAYIIPKGWHNVINLLRLNAIEMEVLTQDTIITVENYKIKTFETRKSPYEGHYQHYNTQVDAFTKQVNFNKGDIIVNTNQNGVRYLLETLEPQAPDSFFNWNFFDTILQQKEGFSPYVWEDKALELIKNDTALQKAFNSKKEKDETFASNWYAQLDWIHKRSNNYEKAHLQYPIYRIISQP